MTFYNVISALLFLGSLRVFLLTIEDASWSMFPHAACLVIVVFNDMLSTSHTVEIENGKYSLTQMLIDLANFLLLALATIVLSPYANLFDAALPRIAGFFGASSFWLLLVVYWLFLMWWSHLDAKAKNTSPRRELVRWRLSVPLAFVLAWSSEVWSPAPIAIVMAGFATGYLLLYLVWLRPRARRLYDGTAGGPATA